MRRIPFAGPFRAVLTFFTTLGYFPDEENRRVIREIARVLEGDGRFLFDHLNADRVRASLVPKSERDVKGVHVVETRWIEDDPPRVKKRVVAREKGETLREYTESVRLYRPEELAEELARAGLSTENVFGDFDGGPWSPASSRLILVGRRGGPGAP
jgi:SAM-dependent methyltransferase